MLCHSCAWYNSLPSACETWPGGSLHSSQWGFATKHTILKIKCISALHLIMCNSLHASSTCRPMVSAIFFTRPSLTVRWAAFCLVMALMSICLTRSLSSCDCLTAWVDDSKICLHSARAQIYTHYSRSHKQWEEIIVLIQHALHFIISYSTVTVLVSGSYLTMQPCDCMENNVHLSGLFSPDHGVFPQLKWPADALFLQC